MGKDITTMLTRERNKKCGRKGYAMWKLEKVNIISPKNYGEYLQKKKR